MPEPITAVWGVYDRACELVMLKPYDCTDNGWPEGYTVERLPLATPEMVRVYNAAMAYVGSLGAVSRLEFTSPHDELVDAARATQSTRRRVLESAREMQVDKERLDWLERDHNARVFPSLGIGADGANWFGVRVEHEGGKGFSPNGKLREAIDAAITQSTTEGATDA